MSLPNVLSAFYLCLIAKMMGGPTVYLTPKRLESSKKDMAEWVVRRNKRMWTNRMKYARLNVSCMNLPRLMLLSPLLRTCQIGSLSGMMPNEHIVVVPKSIKSLRDLFRRYYETGLGFAVEIITTTHFVVVLIFCPNQNDSGMNLTIEVFNRFQGLIYRTNSDVKLMECEHTTTLCCVNMEEECCKKEYSRFFYTMRVDIPVSNLNGCEDSIQMFAAQVVFYTSAAPIYISTSSSKRRKCIA